MLAGSSKINRVSLDSEVREGHAGRGNSIKEAPVCKGTAHLQATACGLHGLGNGYLETDGRET